MERRFVLNLPAGPIVPGVTASQVDTAWLLGEQPAPSPQERELTDAEADALFDAPTPEQSADMRAAARQHVTDDNLLDAIFGDTIARTPEEAKELGW